VLSIEETRDNIAARVLGSQCTTYRINIKIAPLTDAQSDKAIDALAKQAIFSAQLLAGEMPQEIEQAFESAMVSLFPSQRHDLETDCSCPDYANPCKHVAAAHYILGERFDEDPFLIFRLRGRTQEQVMQELRKRRAGADEAIEEETEESKAGSALEDCVANYWEFGAPLEGYSVAIRPPTIEMPLIKRLGAASFVPDPGIESLLRDAYETIGHKALQIAFQEQKADGKAA
jgi:uncharacterized Zn finger protein